MPARTIAREGRVEGPGLHEGVPTRVVFRPAPPGSGIRFRRSDLPGTGEIPALARYREERPRRTALVRERAEVHTVEHLLAAVWGRGLTDLDIEVDGVELPGLDGSARDFYRALVDSGVVEAPGPAPALALDRPLSVTDGRGAWIVALPHQGGFVLDYTLDYGRELPKRRVAVLVTEDTFRDEIAPARTFCLEREAAALTAAGLGRGASYENTLVIGGDGRPIRNAFRFEDELCRHKLLDLLGDLALAGVRLEARVIAYRSGHALNAAMAKQLLELAEGSSPGPSPGASPRGMVLADAGIDVGARTFRPVETLFSGHFPGEPLLAGAFELAALAAAAGGPEAALAAVETARFRRVVRPGEALSLEATAPEGGRARARALVGKDVAAEASLRFRDDRS